MRLLHLQKRGRDGHLFIVEFPEWGKIPFKLPSVSRSRQYAAAILLAETQADTATFYEYVFRECVVDEKIAFDENMPAGIAQSVAELILYLSGTHQDMIQYTENLFDTFRNESNTPVSFMKRVICSVFSGYTFESLGELDYQDLVEVFVNAEAMMLEAGLISEPYTFASPEDEGPRLPRVPMGPAGPGSMPPPQDDMKMTNNGSIDIDALVQDGKRAEKDLNAMPAKGAHNLHDSPDYQARKEAAFARLEKLGG